MTHDDLTTVTAVLNRAAELAEQASTVATACTIGWSTLHRAPTQVMHSAFVAWSREVRDREDDIPGLGEVIRRRCKSTGEVAATLRNAAMTAASGLVPV